MAAAGEPAPGPDFEDFQLDQASCSRLHSTSLTVRAKGCELAIVGGSGFSGLSQQDLMTDVCTVLAEKANSKAPWNQSLSFSSPFDPAFNKAKPGDDLVMLQALLHFTAYVFLWDTDMLANGHTVCCEVPGCSATREKGIQRDQYVKHAHPVYALGGKKVYVYGLKLRCTNAGGLPHSRSPLAVPAEQEIAKVTCLFVVQARIQT